MISAQYSEVFLVAYISLLGLLSIERANFQNFSKCYLTMLAFPLGYTYIVISSVLSLFFLARFDVYFVLSAPLILLLILNFTTSKQLNSYRSISAIVLFNVLLTCVLRFINPVIFSYDSYVFMELASKFSAAANLKDFLTRFTYFPLYIVPMHALCKYYGQDYCSSLTPLFCFSSALVVVYYLKINLVGKFSFKSIDKFILLVAAMFLITVPFIIQQFFYVNGHMAAAYLMTVLALFILSESEENNYISNSSACIFFTLLAGLMFVRIEGLLLCSIFILLIAEKKLLSNRQITFGIVFITLLHGIWSYLLFYNNVITGFTSPLRMLVMIVPIYVILLCYCIAKLQVFLPQLRPISVVFLLSALLLYAFRKPEHYITSLLSILSNMFYSVPWGLIWPVLILFLVLTIFNKQNREQNILAYIILYYIGLVLFLSCFRDPYRINWKDSANRIFIHILPLISYFVLSKIADLSFTRINSSNPET